MFGLTYLSDDRNRQLRKLQERLSTATDNRVRNETDLLIQEILNEAIPYTRCDLYQANELRNQLLDKMSVLQGLGKAGSVEFMQGYLREVDYHIQTKQMEENLKEKNLLRPGEGGNLVERSSGVNTAIKESRERRKQAKGRTRWVIGMDEDSEE